MGGPRVDRVRAVAVSVAGRNAGREDHVGPRSARTSGAGTQTMSAGVSGATRSAAGSHLPRIGPCHSLRSCCPSTRDVPAVLAHPRRDGVGRRAGRARGCRTGRTQACRHRDGTCGVARRFQIIAWPAFGLLLVTGVWNLFAVNVGDQSGSYLTTVFVKLVLVAVSGISALGHTLVARHQPALGGMLAALALLAALGATFVGVLLTTG